MINNFHGISNFNGCKHIISYLAVESTDGEFFDGSVGKLVQKNAISYNVGLSFFSPSLN